MDADMQSDEEKKRKADLIWQKMREKNEELRKRYELVEEDRKCAEASNSSITTAVVTNNTFDSKRPEKSFDEEEWRAERSKIDEERSARASANSQREWDMDKFKQGDESGPEMKFERNYRGGRQANSSGSWGRKFSENRPHEKEYSKSYGSNAQNYSKDRGSFRNEQRFGSGNERTFNYQKQEKGRNYGSSGNWQHDSSQHESNTHISSKVFERTDERSENRYGKRSHDSQPFRRSDSYRQNRHGDYGDSGRSIKQNEDRQASYGNRQPFNRTNQRGPRRDTWSSDDSHEQQNEYKSTFSREQPKMRQNSYTATGYKKESYNKGDNQSSYSSAKSHSYSKASSDSGGGSFVTSSHHSGTWSGCNDNITSHVNSKTKTNEVAGQSSGTWSDCEDNGNKSHAPQGPAVSYVSSRTKTNAVARQSSGTWSDCEDNGNKSHAPQGPAVSDVSSRTKTNAVARQSSGTWSDCEDNGNNSHAPQGPAVSDVSSRTKTNAVAGQSSGTWSDCEDNGNNSHAPLGPAVSEVSSRTKTNTDAGQSSGWSDCDDSALSKTPIAYAVDCHESQRNHTSSPLKSPTRFDDVGVPPLSPIKKPFNIGKATSYGEREVVEKCNNNNNIYSSSWSDCEQGTNDAQKELTKKHLSYSRKSNTYRNERYGKQPRNTNQIRARRNASCQPACGISPPKPPNTVEVESNSKSSVGIPLELSSDKKKSKSFIENASDYDHSDWEYDELNYWEDMPQADSSVGKGFENMHKSYTTSTTYNKRSNAKSRSYNNCNVKSYQKSPHNRIVQSGPNDLLVITKTIENEGSWESLSD